MIFKQNNVKIQKVLLSPNENLYLTTHQNHDIFIPLIKLEFARSITSS